MKQRGSTKYAVDAGRTPETRWLGEKGLRDGRDVFRLAKSPQNFDGANLVNQRAVHFSSPIILFTRLPLSSSLAASSRRRNSFSTDAVDISDLDLSSTPAQHELLSTMATFDFSRLDVSSVVLSNPVHACAFQNMVGAFMAIVRDHPEFFDDKAHRIDEFIHIIQGAGAWALASMVVPEFRRPQ